MKSIKKNKIPDSVDILNYIKEKDDFNFEINVLKLGTDNGFLCKHAGSYIDPLSKKIRQFDLQFEMHFGSFHIFLPIECKNLNPEYPIVISQTPRELNESYHEIIVSKNLYQAGSKKSVNEFIEDDDRFNKSFPVKISTNNKIYPKKANVGKSIMQISVDVDGKANSKNEEIYDKWIQVFGQARSVLNQAAEIYNKNTNDFNFSAIFPILVIPNNCLWTINYDLNGNILNKPKLEDYSELYFGLESSFTDIYEDFFTFSHLKICTFKAFEKYLQKIIGKKHFFNNIFPNQEIDRIVKKSYSA
jgi:hypothetical protein